MHARQSGSIVEPVALRTLGVAVMMAVTVTVTVTMIVIVIMVMVMIVVMMVIVAVVMMMVMIVMKIAMGMAVAVSLAANRLAAFDFRAILRRRPASANRAHYSTSNSLTRISSPPVICT
jgi:hypothetical protein